MKIVSYNIRFALGTDHKIDLERIADTVRDADIIGLQEVERNWERSGMVDQPAVLGDLLKGYYWTYCNSFDMDASVKNDDGTVLNRRRQFGQMVLSRWPILHARPMVFPKLGTVSTFNMDTGAIECVIDTPGGPIRVYSLHLSATSVRDRLLQLDCLLAWHRQTQTNGSALSGGHRIANMESYEEFPGFVWTNGEPEPPVPVSTVVVGDFNSEPDSEEYSRMVGVHDPFYGRVGHLDAFVDSWNVTKKRTGDEACYTWWPDPPGRPPNKPVRLDYCFLDPELGLKVENAWVDTEATGSDHNPYWVELDY